jgi:signal transduction histidine kinase
VNRRKPAQIAWAFNKTLVIALAAVAIVIAYVGFIDLWSNLYHAASSLDIWLIIAVTSLVIATGVMMAGRYAERKLEIEAQKKAQKIEIYDQLLAQLSQLFQREHKNENLLLFIAEWQSKLILWSDSNTLHCFFRWHDSLITQPENSLKMLGRFMCALREEMGNPTSEIEQGALIHLMINHGNFLQQPTPPQAKK